MHQLLRMFFLWESDGTTWNHLNLFLLSVSAFVPLILSFFPSPPFCRKEYELVVRKLV